MGKIEVELPYEIGELVFGVDKLHIQYSCLCNKCDGMGVIDVPAGVSIGAALRMLASDHIDHIDDVDADDDVESFLDDTEVECDACDGFGSSDDEVEIFFPSEIGRTCSVTYQHERTSPHDPTECEDVEEIVYSIHPLMAVGYEGISEIERLQEMMVFYHKMQLKEVGDFKSILSRHSIITEAANIHKSFREACKYAIRNNTEAYVTLYEDLENPGYNMSKYDRVQALQGMHMIKEVEKLILAQFQELERWATPSKRTKSSEKDTEPGITKESLKARQTADTEPVTKMSDALTALASVEVEEALL